MFKYSLCFPKRHQSGHNWPRILGFGNKRADPMCSFDVGTNVNTMFDQCFNHSVLTVFALFFWQIMDQNIIAHRSLNQVALVSLQTVYQILLFAHNIFKHFNILGKHTIMHSHFSYTFCVTFHTVFYLGQPILYPIFSVYVIMKVLQINCLAVKFSV